MSSGKSALARYWICALCISAVLAQRESREQIPLRPPKNQYVGLTKEFQFYVPTVNQPALDATRHRFDFSQRQAATPNPVPLNPIVGASLVAITPQNIDDYYEVQEEETPRQSQRQPQRISLDEQRIYEEQYRRAQEQYKKDEEFRREEIQRLEDRDREYREQSRQSQIRPQSSRRVQAHQQNAFPVPVPTSAPLQSLTSFVAIEDQTHQQPQQHRHRPQQPQASAFPQRHQQPQHQVHHQHFEQPHHHQQDHQQHHQQQSHIIHPHVRVGHPKIDPFAALRIQPSEPKRRPQPQRVEAPAPVQTVFPEQAEEEAFVPQALFTRISIPQEVAPQPQRVVEPRPVQKPRLVIPKSQPRPRPAAPQVPSTRGGLDNPNLSQRRREYEEELFRQQADNAQYEFASGIHDDINGNHQERQEVRDGANVKGMYSFSDGYFKRTVFYEADDKGYRVVKEDVEPLSDGPQVNPRGGANVSTFVDGNEVNYSITADDIQRRQVQEQEHEFRDFV